MSFFSGVYQCTLPLITAASSTVLLATSLLATTPAFANQLPVVVVSGAGGQLQLNNPVQLQGTAQDSDGIKSIFGAIKNVDTGAFVTKDGRFSQEAAGIDINHQKTQATRWATKSYNLPRGRYVLNIRAQDNTKKWSKVIQVPFTATGNNGSNSTLAAAPATNQAAAGAAPIIAIQFPENGATLNQASAFSGIAKDDQSVVGVVATVMNTANGSYLNSRGQFATSGELKLRTIKGKNAQWSTPQLQLPPGNYLLSVKAIDNSGQEGQWAQSKFTVATPAAQASTGAAAVVTPTAVAAGAKAANGMAYCSGNGLDSDGDGYGWQNNASCVVVGSKADTHPNCASSASDPDGDGYGWENEKSCIVVVHCQSAASDADGDGFGWENNRSCIVLKQTNNSGFPACARGAASDPDGDGYGWENNNTCLVK